MKPLTKRFFGGPLHGQVMAEFSEEMPMGLTVARPKLPMEELYRIDKPDQLLASSPIETEYGAYRNLGRDRGIFVWNGWDSEPDIIQVIRTPMYIPINHERDIKYYLDIIKDEIEKYGPVTEDHILVNELTTIQRGSELDHNKDSSDGLVYIEYVITRKF